MQDHLVLQTTENSREVLCQNKGRNILGSLCPKTVHKKFKGCFGQLIEVKRPQI